MGKVADYVIGLLSEILGEEPEREKWYDWARGDVSPKTGKRKPLPFDAVWESRRLIIEIDEDQHRQPNTLFDKPHAVTVSGVDRGQQRPLYDARKRSAARRHGYRVVEIDWERRPPPERRDRETDLEKLRLLLEAARVVPCTRARVLPDRGADGS